MRRSDAGRDRSRPRERRKVSKPALTARTRPRIVFVTRRSPFELLLERHGTHAQARFYCASRGQDIRTYEVAHERFAEALDVVVKALPPDRRRTRVDRGDLDRFLWNDDDVAVVVGQDGLVANTAKYLRGQLLVGVNPDRSSYDGLLCTVDPKFFANFLVWLDAPAEAAAFRVESRTLAVAEREDGQRLLALNELFVGQRSHQSARYRIRADGREEIQSSSGLICATGTGSTGWALSIFLASRPKLELPKATDPALVWFVREPFPSVATGVTLRHGALGPDRTLDLVSLMPDDGVIFADGLEDDRLEFLSGHTVRLSIAKDSLNLVVPVWTATVDPKTIAHRHMKVSKG